MSATDIVNALANADPAYECEGWRQCTLCEAMGKRPMSDPEHTADCPWIAARALLAGRNYGRVANGGA